MGQGIGGGLPKSSRIFYAVPHYTGRRVFYTVESHIDVDTTRSGRNRVLWDPNRARDRATELNRMNNNEERGDGGG